MRKVQQVSLVTIRIALIVAMLTGFLAAWADVSGPVQAGEDDVTLCHVPASDPDHAYTMTVGASEVGGHLAHGDYLGPCPVPEPNGASQIPEVAQLASGVAPEPGPSSLAREVAYTTCDFSPTTVAELIADIQTANGNSQADVICLAASSTYTVTSAFSGSDALPAISSEIILVGNGATLTRDLGAANLRLLVVSSAGDLALNDLTLSNGVADYGGAIRNDGGSLAIVDSVFSDNTATTAGGAIANRSGGGQVTITGFDLQ